MSPEERAFANIEAKLHSLEIFKHFRTFPVLLPDRCVYAGTKGLEHALEEHPDFNEDGIVSGGPHRVVYDYFKLDRDRKMRSFRELKRPSLQITLVRVGNYVYGDIDIDLSSPSMDVVGFFTHLVEVLVPGPTNHYQLAKKMRKQGYNV